MCKLQGWCRLLQGPSSARRSDLGKRSCRKANSVIQVINWATYVVPTNHCRDFSRQNEVAGRLQVRSIEDLWDWIFKIFELIFLTSIPPPVHGRYPLPILWSAPRWDRSSGSQPTVLPGSKGRIRGFSIGYLRFLGRCRTEDPSLGEGLQLQRLQQQMWQEAPKPESITGGGKFTIYLHPLTAENEMWVFQGTASLSVGPCFAITHVLGSVRRDNCTRDDSIILLNVWLWNEILKYMSTEKCRQLATGGDERLKDFQLLAGGGALPLPHCLFLLVDLLLPRVSTTNVLVPRVATSQHTWVVTRQQHIVAEHQPRDLVMMI